MEKSSWIQWQQMSLFNKRVAPPTELFLEWKRGGCGGIGLNFWSKSEYYGWIWTNFLVGLKKTEQCERDDSIYTHGVYSLRHDITNINVLPLKPPLFTSSAEMWWGWWKPRAMWTQCSNFRDRILNQTSSFHENRGAITHSLLRETLEF